jgi:hypothetical protein
MVPIRGCTQGTRCDGKTRPGPTIGKQGRENFTLHCRVLFLFQRLELNKNPNLTCTVFFMELVGVALVSAFLQVFGKFFSKFISSPLGNWS